MTEGIFSIKNATWLLE